MPFRIVASAGFWILVLFSPSAIAAEPDDRLTDFDAYVEMALADFRTPGLAVGIIEDGKVVLARGYGVLRAGDETRVDENTIFPIASVTKVFTATCLAQLVEDGKLDWNDPVVKHVPEFELHDPFLTKDVRLVDLLSHRVGLETGDLLAYRGDYTRAEMLRRLRYLQPVAPFRSRFGYNNHMLTTAGEVLERVGGQPWATILHSRLLKPLDMNATFAGPRELQGRDNVATPHLLVDDKLIPDPLWTRATVHEGYARFLDAIAPAGTIQSNVVDMVKFVQMFLDEGSVNGEPLLKPETVRTMFSQFSAAPLRTAPNSPLVYPRLVYGGAMGWQIRDIRGRKVVMHGGSSGAMAAMMPEERIGIVVLSNRGSGVEFMLMHDVFARMLRLPRAWTNRQWLVEAQETPAKNLSDKHARLEAARAKDSKPSLPLTKYAGTFACDLYGTLVVAQHDDALGVQFGPNIEGRLVHWEHDTFRAKLSFPPGEEWLLRFNVSAGATDRLNVERISWHEPMPQFVRKE